MAKGDKLHRFLSGFSLPEEERLKEESYGHFRKLNQILEEHRRRGEVPR
jgi:hypothetical protein